MKNRSASVNLDQSEQDVVTDIERENRSRTYGVEERPVVLSAVCEMISGGALLKDAARHHGIRRETLWRWLAADPKLQRLFEQARIAQAHALAEEAIDIADEPVRDHADAVRARTRVDVRKWYVAKMAPRIYGEKLQVEQEQHAVIRHVVMLPARTDPPPAIVASGYTPKALAAGQEITQATDRPRG